MASPTDELDPPAMMSSGGLVDPSTAQGQVDEEADWLGSVAALVQAGMALDAVALRASGPRPGGRMEHVTRRRGAYPQAGDRSSATDRS
jgi:hypothetical protein